MTAEVVKIDADKRIVGIKLTTYSGDVPPAPKTEVVVDTEEPIAAAEPVIVDSTEPIVQV